MSRLAAIASIVAALVALPTAAFADPAGPTDYQTVVVGVDPAVDGLEVRMLGGDAFIELTAPSGTEVIVVGYRGEPYLRFAPDGTVWQNRLSESTWLNEDRYAEIDLPAGVDNEAAPEWEEVGSGGRFAWHDHRTHWMNREPPPSTEPGDTILEATVPVDVDGSRATISVRSTYVEPPGPWASSLGAVVGLVLAGAVSRRLDLRIGLATLASAALVVGVWERLSLPTEAAASALVFLLPGGALFFAAIARPPVAAIAATFSAGQLLAWAFLRWPVLTKPILPTAAPWPLDRFVTAMVLTGAAGMLVLAARSALGRGDPASGSSAAPS